MSATSNPDRVEAPVTLKAYLLCVFASFGGIFFGYDSGYMSGCLGMVCKSPAIFRIEYQLMVRLQIQGDW